MQARQHAAGVVPTEGQDLLLHMVGVVFVEAALSPVVHLQDTVSIQEVLRMYHGWWDWFACYTTCGLLYCTLYPLRCPRMNLEGTGSQCISARVLFTTMACTFSGAATGTVQ